MTEADLQGHAKLWHVRSALRSRVSECGQHKQTARCFRRCTACPTRIAELAPSLSKPSCVTSAQSQLLQPESTNFPELVPQTIANAGSLINTRVPRLTFTLTQTLCLHR
jgi:hypothetical protein